MSSKNRNRGASPPAHGADGPAPAPSFETGPAGYTIKHSAVGGHYRGETVPASAFDAGQVDRLLTLGAIVPEGEAIEPEVEEAVG